MYKKGHNWGLVKFQRTHGNNTLAVLHGELREVVWTKGAVFYDAMASNERVDREERRGQYCPLVWSSARATERSHQGLEKCGHDPCS